MKIKEYEFVKKVREKIFRFSDKLVYDLFELVGEEIRKREKDEPTN